MSFLEKKDIGLLIDAGFSMEELGLDEGGLRGIEVYETPEDYFAKELIENAAEQGEIDLLDDINPPIEKMLIEKPDNSHPMLWANQEYDGNDDRYEDVPNELRGQVEWLDKIKIGKISIWQRMHNGKMQWPVKDLRVEIPEEEKDRFNNLSREYKKILWSTYAREEWKRLWEIAVMSLKEFPIEVITTFVTKSGEEFDLLVIPVSNVIQMGYDQFPPEAKWISFVFFYKD